jgi:hypothetical protein
VWKKKKKKQNNMHQGEEKKVFNVQNKIKIRKSKKEVAP